MAKVPQSYDSASRGDAESFGYSVLNHAESAPLGRMKICDVTQFYSPRSGGVRRYVHEKRQYVLHHTADEHYLIVPGERTERTDDGRLHLLTVASPRVDRTSRYRILFNMRVVREYLHEVKPDLIEAGDPYHVAWSLLKLGREMRIPVCGFYHSHFPDAYLRTALKYGGPFVRDVILAYAQDYIERLYTQFARTLVPSTHLCQLLRSWGVMNAVAVRLGVDTKVFQPGTADAALRAELKVPPTSRMLLYVGRLAGEKNIATLTQAFALLRQRRDDVWLVIVGDGPQRRLLPGLRRETRALSWKPYINDNALLSRYYHAADLFVHPGVVETFGLVSLESQACGCPVVGIRGTNMDPNIMAGLEHWAERNTPEDLAAAIERMLAIDLKPLGQSAAKRVAAEFAWPTVLQDLWRHYRDSVDQYRK